MTYMKTNRNDLFKHINNITSIVTLRKTILTLLVLMTVGVGEMWGQIMFNNTTASGTSLSWATGDKGQIITTNASDTKQQWLLKDTGDGKYNFYNIGSEGNHYYSKNSANNWTMTFIEESNLSTSDYVNRAKFSLNDLGSGTYSIGTCVKYLGTDATATGSEVWGDKDANESKNGIWTIQEVCTLTITYEGSQYSISTTNQFDGSIISRIF